MVIGRKTMSVVIVIVGIAVAVYGGFQLRTFQWEDATGTLSDCTSRQTRDERSGERLWHFDCTVTWTAADGTARTAEHLRIDAEAETERSYGDGDTIPIKVSGDEAVTASTSWLAIVGLVGGVLITAVGLGRLFSRAKPRPVPPHASKAPSGTV